VFHDNAAKAEVAGYRACMRCRPREEDESAGDPQKIAVSKACGLIQKEGEGGTKWAVKSLAKEVGLTESHFCRVFKKIMNITIGEYRTHIMAKETRSKKEVVPSKALPTVQIAASPSEFQYSVAGLQTQDSFDSELARDWQKFSGTVDLTGTIDMFPCLSGADLESFSFSPEPLSDASTPAMTDDGFQFLNFDEVSPSIAHDG
jgi:AraC-like DNA-binding protein